MLKPFCTSSASGRAEVLGRTFFESLELTRQGFSSFSVLRGFLEQLRQIIVTLLHSLRKAQASMLCHSCIGTAEVVIAHGVDRPRQELALGTWHLPTAQEDNHAREVV